LGERQPIVIAGAGIGGLTAALALASAGQSVVVCERAGELSEVGAGIQLSPNAGRVLAALGLDEAIGAKASEPKAIDIRSGASGALIVSLPLGDFPARYGLPYRVIHRADLQSILATAARAHADIELRLGAFVAGFEQYKDGVAIEANARRQTIRAAALIAADGVWSSLRSKIAPRAARPTGRTAWRAVMPSDRAPAGLASDRTGLWLGVDAHLVHYPVAKGAEINLVAIVDEDWREEGWSAPGDPEWLRARFASWSEVPRAIVGAPVEWLKWALVAVDPSGPWVDGRAALLGDAAHAMAPYLAQGAAMAIEDAAVLAQAIGATPDVQAALRAYERERRPRVERVWRAAARTGDYYHLGAAAGAIRDTVMRLGGPRLLLARNDWVYRWTAES
jgi:salicylate hydroxylase